MEPGERVTRVEMLSEGERRQVVVEWNGRSGSTAGEVRAGAVRGAGERRRKRWRWCTGSSELSYGELNERANQLAQYLAEQGSGTGGAWWGCAWSAVWRWWWGCWGS